MIDFSPSVAIQVTEFEEIDMKYVNRGDPAVPDFELADFPVKDNWTMLDLSAIVPAAGANHLVHLHISIESAAGVVGSLNFREAGNVNEINLLAGVGIEFADYGGWVMMNANRQVEYFKLVENANLISAEVSVRGWWTD